MNGGRCGLPADKLEPLASRILEVPDNLIRTALKLEMAEGAVVADRLDRCVDKLTPELHDLQSTQDGSEVKSHKLEIVSDWAQNFGDRRDAFERMRDTASDP